MSKLENKSSVNISEPQKVVMEYLDALLSEIDPEIRVRYEPLLLRFLRVPAVQSWWSRQREFIAEPFRSEVDSLLRTIPGA